MLMLVLLLVICAYADAVVYADAAAAADDDDGRHDVFIYVYSLNEPCCRLLQTAAVYWSTFSVDFYGLYERSSLLIE
jgi:hypothetical protein